jgi:hypothetical protein
MSAARISVLILLAGIASAQKGRRDCLEYGPVEVRLDGRIERQTFPGPPNYGSVTEGDKPDVQWILHLSNSVCVNEQHGDEINQAESGVLEIQLVIMHAGDWKRYSPLVGKSVQVKGTLFHGFNAHHQTAVLLQVGSIEAHTKK